MKAMRKKVETLMVREVGDEVVLLDVEADKVHQLNGTASSIWRMCEQAESPEAMARVLAEQYDVQPDVALKDVNETLEKLQALKLLVSG